MKRLALITATIVATLSAVWLAWELRGVILIFFASLATAAALRPAATWLARRHIHPTAALAIAYLIAAASIAIVIAVAVSPVAGDIERLSADSGRAYEVIRDEWPRGSPIEQSLARYLPQQEQTDTPLAGVFSGQIRALLGVTLGVVATGINVVLVVILSIYWSFDRVAFERLWLSLLPVERRTAARDIWRAIEQETGAYLRSEIIQCVAAGLLLNWGFSLLGYPYPALLALIGAVAWIIPWVGGALAVAAVVIASLPATLAPDGPSWASVALPASLYTLVVLSFLEFVVEPRLFDRRRYNAILVVILMVGLADWLGIWGLLLGPPLAAALQILGLHLLEQRQQAAMEAATADVIDAPASLQSRLEEIRATLSRSEQDRPELASLVDRLSELINQAKEVPRLPAAKQRSVTAQ
jgi:predicted PurR-regulated permease PerM